MPNGTTHRKRFPEREGWRLVGPGAQRVTPSVRNHLGAIVGSLGAGLVLVPTLGTQTSMALIALLFCGTGLWLEAVQTGSGVRIFTRPAVALAGVAVLVAAGASMAMPYRVALNFNQSIGEGAELRYHAEGVQSTIDVVRSHSGITSLVIGGNIEANDEYTQLRPRLGKK